MTTRLTDGSQLIDVLRARGSLLLHPGCAEPLLISEHLARLAPDLAGLQVYSFMPMGASPYAHPPASDHLKNVTFFPGKGMRDALTHARATPVRMALSRIPDEFRSGRVKIDVLALQVSPPDETGHVSLGVSLDFMPEVLGQSPTVIAQINPRMPRTRGPTSLPLERIDFTIDSDRPIQEISRAEPDAVDMAIARHVTQLVVDGAVLQIGIGALPDAVASQLGHLKHLGLHSGIITEGVIPLIESGVIDNSRKRRHRGVSVTTMAGGSASLYRFVESNPSVEFHPCAMTHAPETLRAIDRLTAINSALQVDLQGGVNAESIGPKRISLPGGLPDFSAGAAASAGGLSILALRSKAGGSSTVLSRLGADAPRTISMEVVDYVVTEHGLAKVRGVSPRARAQALISVADPMFREQLSRDLAEMDLA